MPTKINACKTIMPRNDPPPQATYLFKTYILFSHHFKQFSKIIPLKKFLQNIKKFQRCDVYYIRLILLKICILSYLKVLNSFRCFYLNFNTQSQHFTKCQNSIPSSRYSCLSTAVYGGKQTFPKQKKID